MVGMDRAVGSKLSVLLPRGDLHLAAPPPMAPAASQPQRATLTPPATHLLL